MKSGEKSLPLDGRPILVVDDEVNMRLLLKEFFTERGCVVLEAENGKAALSLISSRDISVVLLDVEMPVMDGLTTLKKILEIVPGMKVIMVSAVQSDEKVREALETGAYDYVLKPFDFLYLELAVLSKPRDTSGP